MLGPQYLFVAQAEVIAKIKPRKIAHRRNPQILLLILPSSLLGLQPFIPKGMEAG
jgi:hypothetical protein